MKALQASPFMKGVYIAIAISFFLGFGVLSAVRGCGETGTGLEVAGEKVLPGEYELILRDLSRGLESRDEETLRKLRQIALRTLVTRKVLAKVSKEVGFDLPPVLLTMFISKTLGLTTKAQYFGFLKSMRVSPKAFERGLRDSYLVERLRDIVARYFTLRSKDMLYLLYRIENERVKVSMAFFKLPNVKVSRWEILKEYRENRAKYINPETRFALIAEFKTWEEASKAYERIKGGESFEDVCSSASEKISYSLSEPIDSKIFFLRRGEVSEPFELDGLWYLAYLRKVIPSRPKTLEEAEDEIRENIRMEKSFKLAFRKAERIMKTRIKTTRNFKRLAKKFGAEVFDEEIPVATPVVPRIGFSPDVLSALQSEKENFMVEKPIAIGDGIYVVWIGERKGMKNFEVNFAQFSNEVSLRELGSLLDRVLNWASTRYEIKVPEEL